MYEAVLPYLRKSLRAAVKPTLANIASVGIVTLPGMMTGQILGGASPLVAIKYQITIMCLKPTVSLNTLDIPGRGLQGIYTTVTGTSAEDADGGQVGRGNRVNGIIPLNRPVSSEAAAGKNPVSHTGKVYNLLSHRIAAQIYSKVPDISEVYVWLLSEIGTPIDQPQIATAQLVMKKGSASEVEKEVAEVMEKELENIQAFSMSAIGQVASISGRRTVLSGQRIAALSPIKWTPQKTMTSAV